MAKPRLIGKVIVCQIVISGRTEVATPKGSIVLCLKELLQ